MVGEYVPFYFCPRSIMLYILYMGNHPDLTHYRDGQEPILHLQVDLESAVNWANQTWCALGILPDRNAGSIMLISYNSSSELDNINWDAVKANQTFATISIKEGKQAEFLIHDSLPLASCRKNWGIK